MQHATNHGSPKQTADAGTVTTDGARADGIRPIFRAAARRQPSQGDVTVVLPWLVSQPAFTLLWFVACGLAVIGGLVAFWPLLTASVPYR